MESEQDLLATESTELKSEIKNKSPQTFLRGFLWGIGIIILLVIVGGGLAAFRFPDQVPGLPKLLSKIHTPAALVGGRVISWHDIDLDMQALQRFSADDPQSAGLTTDQFRYRALHKQMFMLAATKYAQNHGIEVSDSKLDSLADVIFKQLGGRDEVLKKISDDYSWNYLEYRDRIILSMYLNEEIQKQVSSDETLIGPARKKATEALQQIKSGKDFAEVVKKFSEDVTAAAGGELGFISKGDTVPEFEAAIFGMNKGETSELVQTQFGFHIIQIEEIKKGKDGAVEQVRARHILVRTPSPREMVEKELSNLSVWQFLHTSVPARQTLDTRAPNA